MSTVQERLNRNNTLWQLLNRLPGEHFADRPACASDAVDPELFFPVGPGARLQIAAAKRVCAACPVRQACLSFALHTDVDGIWGGTTHAERAELRRTDNGAAVAAEVA